MNNNANLKMTRNGNEMQRKPSGGGRKQIEKKKKSEMNIQHGLELRESKRKKSSVKGYKQKGTK